MVGDVEKLKFEVETHHSNLKNALPSFISALLTQVYADEHGKFAPLSQISEREMRRLFHFIYRNFNLMIRKNRR